MEIFLFLNRLRWTVCYFDGLMEALVRSDGASVSLRMTTLVPVGEVWWWWKRYENFSHLLVMCDDWFGVVPGNQWRVRARNVFWRI